VEEEKKERIFLPYARVLVVDDVPTNLAVARALFKPYGMTVETANSGREAIELIKESSGKYDAVFMDYMMPEMDGMETTRIIREEMIGDYPKRLPVIALTANALPGNEELLLQNGFNAFMTKPIKTALLNEVLLKWVRDEEKEKTWTGQAASAGDVDMANPQPLPDSTGIGGIDGVDIAAGTTQFGGEANYLEIIKIFIANTPKLLKSIREIPAAVATASEALKNYTITVHGLKGSCYGICANEVGRKAAELEQAAKAGDLDKIIEQNEPFIEAAEDLVEKLNSLFVKDENKPEKETLDKTVLEKLLEAAKTYNINGMESALTELDGYSYTTGTEILDKLREAVYGYEYKEVVKLLE
jgi:CheY-like chemotaxis protein